MNSIHPFIGHRTDGFNSLTCSSVNRAGYFKYQHGEKNKFEEFRNSLRSKYCLSRVFGSIEHFMTKYKFGNEFLFLSLSDFTEIKSLGVLAVNILLTAWGRGRKIIRYIQNC